MKYLKYLPFIYVYLDLQKIINIEGWKNEKKYSSKQRKKWYEDDAKKEMAILLFQQSEFPAHLCAVDYGKSTFTKTAVKFEFGCGRFCIMSVNVDGDNISLHGF
eukprot:55609_1